MKRTILFITLALLSSYPAFGQVVASPALMNFQGRLAKPDGTPVANGNYSVRFSLWTAVTGGTEKWNQTVNPVTVRNGTFAVPLNVASPTNLFDTNLWLEIKIGTAAALTPRQQLVSVAFAIKANTVPDSSITSAKIVDGTITSADIANGTIGSADLAPGALNPVAWLLSGNSGTTASHFFGTTDTKPLVFKANSRRAMQYQYAEYTAVTGSEYRSINTLGGSEINSIGPDVVGATIAGGGWDSFTGTDYSNRVLSSFGAIGGGIGNTISNYYGTVGGGGNNIVSGDSGTIGGGGGNTASSYFVTVGGGFHNTASEYAGTIGGGYNNTSSGYISTIGGGLGNQATGYISVVGGGGNNTASNSFSLVGGGYQNQATSEYASVGGGHQNSARNYHATVAGGSGNDARGFAATVGGGGANYANGDYAIIPGGYSNTANGIASFAAGHKAYAAHAGSFVWSDNSHALDFFASTAPNQFCIQAYGGLVLETGQNAWMYTSSTAGEKNRYFMLLNSFQTPSASGLKAGGILCADDFGYANPGKNDLFVKGVAAIGYNNVGGYKFAVNGAIYCIGFTNASDARYKQNIAPFGNALETILQLRGVTFDWNREGWKEQNFPEGKQIGFIAQEVEKVLPELVSADSKGYKSVAYANVVPVLVEAVKTLKVQKDTEVKMLREENAGLKAEIEALKTAVRQLQEQHNRR